MTCKLGCKSVPTKAVFSWLESYQKCCKGRLSPSTGTVVEKAGKEMKTKQGQENVTKK